MQTMTMIPVLPPPRQAPSSAYLRVKREERRAKEVALQDQVDSALRTAHQQMQYQQHVVSPDSQLPWTPANPGSFPLVCVSECGSSSSSTGGDTRDGPASDTSVKNDASTSSGSWTLSAGAAPQVDFDATSPTAPVVTPSTSVRALLTLEYDHSDIASYTSSIPMSCMEIPRSADESKEDQGVSYDELASLLEETSKRWKCLAQSNHREFCRLKNCEICAKETAQELQGQRRQQQQQPTTPETTTVAKSTGATASPFSLIFQQEQEIAALKKQLQLTAQHEEIVHVAKSGLHIVKSTSIDHDDIDVDSILPMEQIEVYHDDDQVTVTSGLTNLNGMFTDDAGAIASMQLPLHQQRDPPLCQRRPDAESVCELSQTASRREQAAATNKRLSREQDHFVPQLLNLLSGDGTTQRQAVYTGPWTSSGHATGDNAMLYFVETGDWYRGQVVNGQMHGHGTFTFKQPHGAPEQNRKNQVLEGRFENNVYIGMV